MIFSAHKTSTVNFSASLCRSSAPTATTSSAASELVTASPWSGDYSLLLRKLRIVAPDFCLMDFRLILLGIIRFFFVCFAII